VRATLARAEAALERELAVTIEELASQLPENGRGRRESEARAAGR